MKHIKNLLMGQILEVQETSEKTMVFPEGVFGFEFDREYSVKNFNDGFLRIASLNNPEIGFWLVEQKLLKEIVKVQKESEFKPDLNKIVGGYYILTGSMFDECLQVNLKAPIFDEDGKFFQRVLSDNSLIVNFTLVRPRS